MIVVYSPHPTPRIEFAAKLLFGIVLGAEFRMVENLEAFNEMEGFKINYSEQEARADIHWAPHEMLCSTSVTPLEIEFHSWNGLPVFFRQNDPHCPFDMMAASFYLATRYEEYLPHTPDRHGRFSAEQSLASKHQFLERPLINEWAQHLRWHILKVKPEVRFEVRSFQAEATFDIDVAWAYKHKGLFRAAAAFSLDVVSLNFSRFLNRWRVLFGNETDPYDTYFYMRELCDYHNTRARYFFLLGDYSNFDRNSSHKLPAMQELIQSCANHGKVGIHPSYGSHQSVQQLQKEIGRLSGILGANVKESRQHYLKMTFPETYQRLLDVGVVSDFTLGYAQEVGFRASLCTPFPFFDLSENLETGLWLHPFAYMDGTLQQYMKMDVESALVKVEELVKAVAKVDGQFSCLWHNSSLCDKGDWQGWRKVFEHTLKCGQSVNRG